MADINDGFLSLLDIKNKHAEIGNVAEVLMRKNPMNQDCKFVEMNMGDHHVESLRSDLPEVYYRKANQAIPASKSSIEERTFNSARFESKVQMDQLVAERGGKERLAFNRWNQAQGHLQAQANEHASLMLYGSPLDGPHKVPGFFDVLSTLNTAEATSAQIIDAGGVTSDLNSILCVVWGPNSVFGAYPKGTMGGLQRTDRSKSGPVKFLGTDVNGNPGEIWGYEEEFVTNHALIVKDYRYISRIANIDHATLKSGVGAADLIDAMIDMLNVIEDLEAGQPVIYMNRTVKAFLDKQALSKVGAGGGLTYDNFGGKRLLHFNEVPIRRCDAMLSTEDRITT